MDFEFKIAKDLDHAWLNFEPNIPLTPEPDGSNNPFYVPRPDEKIEELKQKLLRPFYQPPKHFLSGHRGCGKSTELYRLAAAPDIQRKFLPIHFSIRDYADINDLDFKDVLLAIGGQLFTQYQGKLDKQLLKELDSWRGEIEEQITTLKAGRMEGEVGAEVGSLFAKLTSKVKLEPKTRHEIRQLFDRDITGLVDVINKIAIDIRIKEGRYPLVLIDDLDKPDLEIARQIFYERQEIMMRPTCAIVYTISSPLFYNPVIRSLPGTTFLPNIKLHEEGKREVRDPSGFYTLKQMVHHRIDKDANLITDEALELAVMMSGGVFRELTQLMRGSINRASTAKRQQIELADVERTAAEIRSHYWRILTAEQRTLLQQIREDNQMRDPEEMAPLLQMLAVLEYDNGKTWCDTHPVLDALLDEDQLPAFL